jgi:hypothetical protein
VSKIVGGEAMSGACYQCSDAIIKNKVRHPLFFVGSDFAGFLCCRNLQIRGHRVPECEVGVCGNAMQVVALVLAILVRNSAALAIAARCGWRLVDRMETSP